MIEPAVIVGPMGVVVASVISVLAYRRSGRVDKNVERQADIETQTGMAGLVIAGWRDLATDTRAERDRLREQLDDCLARERPSKGT